MDRNRYIPREAGIVVAVLKEQGDNNTDVKKINVTLTNLFQEFITLKG